MKLRKGDASLKRVLFTKEMRKDYTILCPQMSPIHFDILEPAFRKCGYNLEVMAAMDKDAIDAGLKYVNNDACYPALITIGQLMNGLLSGNYDLNRTALLISQTGGGCRATNYIAFIRKALENAGMPNIPVISINPAGLERTLASNMNLRSFTEPCRHWFTAIPSCVCFTAPVLMKGKRLRKRTL